MLALNAFISLFFSGRTLEHFVPATAHGTTASRLQINIITVIDRVQDIVQKLKRVLVQRDSYNNTRVSVCSALCPDK